MCDRKFDATGVAEVRQMGGGDYIFTPGVMGSANSILLGVDKAPM